MHSLVSGEGTALMTSSRATAGPSLVLGLVLNLALVHAVPPDVFTNSFLVRLKSPQDEATAHLVARRNGFWNLGPVSIFLELINMKM